MRDFDLLIPRSLDDALLTLARADHSIQALAGGTDMMVNVRARLVQPDVLVSLNDIAELRGVERVNGSIRIGAGTRINDFLTDPLLLEHADLARQGAYVFANPMIRNLATVGGNIATASPAGDIIPPLLALNGEIELAHKNETRRLPLREFFIGPRKTVRRADELILNLYLPVNQPHTAGGFYKLGLRQADAISVVSVAAWLKRDGEKVQDVRIALGAVAPRPLRAERAEAVLRGQRFTDSLFSEAARVAAGESSPIDDLRGTAAYRRRMAQVYVKRMLEKAWKEAE